MAHVQNNAAKPTIIGSPLHPVEGDIVRIAEGKLGNPILLNDDDLFVEGLPQKWGKDFYILVAGEKGKTAREVAQILEQKYRLSIRPFVPGNLERSADESTFELQVHPDLSRHYLDQEVRETLRFRPDLQHQRALFGEKADYFMVNVSLPNDREAIFGNDFREPKNPAGDPFRDESGAVTGENINVRKFDLIQERTDGVVEIMRRGALAIYDRQDLNGNPDTLYGVNLSDLHLAKTNDELEEGILLRHNNEDVFLRFNNANANFSTAIIPWLNEEYRKGRLDWVQILGDNVDYAGQNHSLPENAVESNFTIFAKMLDQIEAPVFVLLGNHDILPEAFPVTLTAQNFNLEKKEVREIIPRYKGIAGPAHFFEDTFQSIMNDPNTLIAYHDLINPFHDTVINFGQGDLNDPQSREAHFVLFDTGGADWAHFRQDDPVYQELQFWPWNMPYIHGVTLMETFTQESPDVRGPLPDQISWLANELAKNAHITLLSHAPVLNSSRFQEPYDPTRNITPLEKSGSYEDLSFNTTAHGGQLFQLIADSPNVRLHMGGHTHFDGNAYVLGVDYENTPTIYRGPVREVLEKIDPQNNSDVHHFWYPEEPCAGDCTSETDQLNGSSSRTMRNRKFLWQVGSATVYNNEGKSAPVFTRLSLNPEGLIAGEEHFYVIKNLRKDPTNPHNYGTTLEVSTEPLHNNRLIPEWKKIREENPQATFDWAEAKENLEKRTPLDETSYIPNPDSLNNYPRYLDTVTHSFVSPTKLKSHFRLKLYGNVYPPKNNETFELNNVSFGGEVQYLFNENQIGVVPRTLFLQGLEGGFIKDKKGGKAYAAFQTPPIVDWKISPVFTLRGINFSLGPGMQFFPEPKFYFHNHMNMFELEMTPKTNNPEKGASFLVGVDRHGIIGNGEWLWYGGLNFSY